MRSRSRMSLISRTRRSEFDRAIRSRLAAFPFTSPRVPDESRPRAPRMDVSGVRNSWLTGILGFRHHDRVHVIGRGAIADQSEVWWLARNRATIRIGRKMETRSLFSWAASAHQQR